MLPFSFIDNNELCWTSMIIITKMFVTSSADEHVLKQSSTSLLVDVIRLCKIIYSLRTDITLRVKLCVVIRPVNTKIMGNGQI